MGSITNVRSGAKELHERLSLSMVAEARDRGISFSQFLEEEDPTDAYGSDERLTALERQLEIAGITTTTDRSAGYYADTFDAFNRNEATRILGAEWAERTFASVGVRTTMLSDLLNIDGPYAAAVAQIREEQLQPAIPVDSLLAGTATINGDSWRPLYVKAEGADLVHKRVAEGDPIPAARIELGKNALTLLKYGRAIVATYELMRRMPIDLVALYIRMAARQVELDRVDTVRQVLVEGDGNPGTAAEVIDLSDLGTDFDLKAWISFKTSVQQPYAMNTVLVSQNNAVKLMFLPVTTSAGTLLVQLPNNGLGGFELINGGISQDIQVGIIPGMSDDFIIGFDRNNAVQRVIESGSNIAETEKWIRNQTHELTFSQNEGYAVMQPGAAKVLDLTS